MDKERAGDGVGRTCHSQAFQLSQTQEGSRLHSADDIVPQVPVGSSGKTFTLQSEGHPALWVGHPVTTGAGFLWSLIFPLSQLSYTPTQQVSLASLATRKESWLEKYV